MVEQNTRNALGILSRTLPLCGRLHPGPFPMSPVDEMPPGPLSCFRPCRAHASPTEILARLTAASPNYLYARGQLGPRRADEAPMFRRVSRHVPGNPLRLPLPQFSPIRSSQPPDPSHGQPPARPSVRPRPSSGPSLRAAVPGRGFARPVDGLLRADVWVGCCGANGDIVMATLRRGSSRAPPTVSPACCLIPDSSPVPQSPLASFPISNLRPKVNCIRLSSCHHLSPLFPFSRRPAGNQWAAFVPVLVTGSFPLSAAGPHPARGCP